MENTNQNKVMSLAKSMLELSGKIANNPAVLAENESFKQSFVDVYEERHGKGIGKIVFEQEMLYFTDLVNTNPELQKCSVSDLFKCFINIAVHNISLAPEKNLCYLLTRKKKLNDVMVTQPYLQLSPYGKVAVLEGFGQISGVSQPTIVYDCDYFEHENNNGKITLKHKPVLDIPANARIIASYVYVTAHGRQDLKIFFRNEIEAWRKASPMSSGVAWGSGVIENAVGMVQAKTIKHALKHYPNVSILHNKAVVPAEFTSYMEEGDGEFQPAPKTVNPLKLRYEEMISDEVFETERSNGVFKPFEELLTPTETVAKVELEYKKRKEVTTVYVEEVSNE